jgi:hypothetical protein
MLFKFKSDVTTKQSALVNLVKFNGLYHQDVKKLQTKLLRSLKFRVVAVYEFSKNKNFNVIRLQNASNQYAFKMKHSICWCLVRALRKIVYHPREHQVSYTKKMCTVTTKNKKESFEISTILDKVLQQLLCFILEPLVELTSDFSSFGCRRYRSAKMAVGFLKSRFKALNKQLFLCRQSDNLEIIPRPNMWVFDSNISGFFHRIHHKYVLTNLFLPSVGIFLVQSLLSVGILHQPIFAKSLGSVFQGGVLFSVLVNFTLNSFGAAIIGSVYLLTRFKSKNTSVRKTDPKYYYYLDHVRYCSSIVVLCYNKYIFEV